jgi:serine/threonine protein kinase/Tol biopolymer transport system component
MSFTEGKQIGRYEIISLLGSGGMGEVYLAKDNQLRRQVAVKILKKTEDPDRFRRFRQEARAASALNHPNILSIYEFGQHEDFHFIVTELVRGETLRRIISEGKLNLKRAVEIAIQVGNTLVVAHEAGIIHRDIKPENIMILPDGYVKVLDFGLAKLCGEEMILENPQDSTVSLLQTKPGQIVGTVNYMSPEQLRGRNVDERADLWSLGVILFEMIAVRRPFTGESVNDVIAAILERPVPVLSEISPEIPCELENIISKGLAKNKEERYRNAKEFVSDLRAFKQLLSGEASLNSQKAKTLYNKNRASAASFAAFSDLIFRNVRSRWFGVSIISVLIFIGLGGWFYLQNPFKQTARSPRQIKAKPVPTSGNVLNAVLSPDGRFIAYLQDDNGKQSLRLRQVNENADNVLIPAEAASYGGIQFSPDSNAIFYAIFKDSPTGQLYRKPILGGTAQKIIEDVDSAVAFSPDGKQFAFIRTKSHEGVDQVIVSDINGINPRTLSERKYPSRYSITGTRESLAWSPDGKTIASAAGIQDTSGEQMTIIEIDVAKGIEKKIISANWFRVGKIVWTKDGQDLIFTAADFGTELYQILRLSRSNGQIEKITTELNDYLNISITSDSKFLLAVADDRSCNLYIAPSTTPNQTTQIAGGNLEGMGGLTWTSDGKILYVSTESGNRDIWIMDDDGKNRRQLTFDKASDEYPSISVDGRYIAFTSLRTSVPHVWLMKPDGSSLEQLTDKGGEAFPQILPDGSAVFYTIKPLKIWKLSTGGGEPAQLTETPANWVAVSHDGSKIAGLTMSPGLPMRLSVFSAENGKILKTFDLVGEAGTPSFPPMLRWNPDGQAVGYISTENGVSNIMVQSLQDERKPKKLTDFSADRIFAFDWSKDGGKIAVARGTARNKLLLFEDF